MSVSFSSGPYHQPPKRPGQKPLLLTGSTPMPADALHRLRRQAHAAYVIAKKDALIYYLKPPVISFGIVFPLFSYLAFAAGRSVPTEMMVPGIVAMALFFTASAIGPLVAFSAMGC